MAVNSLSLHLCFNKGNISHSTQISLKRCKACKSAGSSAAWMCVWRGCWVRVLQWRASCPHELSRNVETLKRHGCLFASGSHWRKFVAQTLWRYIFADVEQHADMKQSHTDSTQVFKLPHVEQVLIFVPGFYFFNCIYFIRKLFWLQPPKMELTES